MKKIFIKVLLSLMIGMLMISTFAMTRPVEASSISASPLTYDEENFSFSGQRTISKLCTGWWVTITVNCTSTGSSNEEIEMQVLIANSTKKTYTFKADGKDHKFSNIYMGIGSGNKSVACQFTNKTTGYSTISGKIIFDS